MGGVEALKTAAQKVQERGEVYGTPRVDMARIAAIWSQLLGVEIVPAQVPMCMIAVKLSRLVTSPNHEDSVVDIAGYAAVMSECQERGET
jgi:hypothetical protein